jgi:DHA3 family tetracycline resistance protein-like MFS transporter
MGTALEISVFIFEIPTGIVADLYSRKTSILIGNVLIGLGFILMGSTTAFWPLMLSQVLWGLGFTFTSGATQAWISDEIGEEHAASAFLRATQMEQFGGMLGIFLFLLLGGWRLDMPILTSGVLFILLSVFLFIRMPETGFHPVQFEQRMTWKSMLGKFRESMDLIKLRPLLMGILAFGFFLGLYSEGFDRLWTAHILDQFALPQLPQVIRGAFGTEFTEVLWLAAVEFCILLLTSLISGWLHKRIERHGITRLMSYLMVAVTCLFFTLAGFALIRKLLLAVILYVAISVIRSLISPLYTAWVNQRLDSQIRATIISTSSQVDAIGQIAGGPVVGLFARRFGYGAGLVFSTALLSPVFLVFIWLRKIEKNKNPVDLQK